VDDLNPFVGCGESVKDFAATIRRSVIDRDEFTIDLNFVEYTFNHMRDGLFLVENGHDHRKNGRRHWCTDLTNLRTSIRLSPVNSPSGGSSRQPSALDIAAPTWLAAASNCSDKCVVTT